MSERLFGVTPKEKGHQRQRQRQLTTIIEDSVPDVEVAMHLFGQEHSIVQVDVVRDRDFWFAFVLYEEYDKSE